MPFIGYDYSELAHLWGTHDYKNTDKEQLDNIKAHIRESYSYENGLDPTVKQDMVDFLSALCENDYCPMMYSVTWDAMIRHLEDTEDNYNTDSQFIKLFSDMLHRMWN